MRAHHLAKPVASRGTTTSRAAGTRTFPAEIDVPNSRGNHSEPAIIEPNDAVREAQARGFVTPASDGWNLGTARKLTGMKMTKAIRQQAATAERVAVTTADAVVAGQMRALAQAFRIQAEIIKKNKKKKRK